jgi:hypothetical protein
MVSQEAEGGIALDYCSTRSNVHLPCWAPRRCVKEIDGQIMLAKLLGTQLWCWSIGERFLQIVHMGMTLNDEDATNDNDQEARYRTSGASR